MHTKHFGLILSVLFLASLFGGYKVEAQSVPPTILTVDLRIGDNDYGTGNQVSMLQRFLAATGYFNVDVTGHFGSVTRASVIRFQQENNITPAEGFVGPITRACISLVSSGHACGGGVVIDPIYPNLPLINGIFPTSGPVGTTVSISGVFDPKDTTVYFGKSRVPLTINAGANPSFVVPSTTQCDLTYPNWISAEIHTDNGYACTDAIFPVTPGNYEVVVVEGGQKSNAVNFSVTSGTHVTPPCCKTDPVYLGNPATIVNVSSRAQTLNGDGVAISGFTVGGAGGSTADRNAVKKVLVRGIGPSLSTFGLQHVLADPTISIRNSAGVVVASNNNWQDTDAAAIQATGVAPTNPYESAILTTLSPGSYTVTLSGNNISNDNNIGVVEVYSIQGAAELTGVSTRGKVDGDDRVIISGMIVQSTTGAPQQFVFRGIGPSLSNSGLSGVISDPTITLYNSVGTAIATNDNWAQVGQEDPQASAIRATGLAPSNDRESVIMKTLTPGAYTVVMRGVNNATGIGLVEIYKISGGGTTGCGGPADTTDCDAPHISSVSPSSGPVGAQITITGSGFTSTGNHVVTAGIDSSYDLANVASSNGRSLTFTMPSSAGRYCPSGEYCPQDAAIFDHPPFPHAYSIKIINANGTSNAGTFTVTANASTNITAVTSLINRGSFVGHLYRCMLNRDPDQSGLDYWVGTIATDPDPINHLYRAFFAAQDQSLSNRAFATEMYNCALFRAPENSNMVDYWANEISSGRQTKASVLEAFLASPEYRTGILPRLSALPLLTR